MLTVRVNNPAFRSRSATVAASRSITATISAGSTRSVANVSSTEIDFASRTCCTGRSSRANASSCSTVPAAWPAHGPAPGAGPLQVGRGDAAGSAGPWSPGRPRHHPHRQRRDHLQLSAGRHHQLAIGFGGLGRQFCDELLDPTPTDARSPSVRRPTSARSLVTRSTRPAGSSVPRPPAARSTTPRPGPAARPPGRARAAAPSRSGWTAGRRRTGRPGMRHAVPAAWPRRSTSPSGRRRPAPRSWPWQPLPGHRYRRPRPACRADWACRAARSRRRTRPGQGAGSTGWPACRPQPNGASKNFRMWVATAHNSSRWLRISIDANVFACSWSTAVMV